MLEVTGLQVRYGAVPGVRHLDLSLSQGEVVALLGRNGAGKTSTLGAMAGLVRCAAGKVVVDGRDVTSASPARRLAAGIALAPEGRGTFPDLTVGENLKAGLHRLRLSRRAADARVAAVGEQFPRLAERLDQRAGSLSGGEQQMLAVARALLSEPRYLLLDEPSLGLAPKTVAELNGHLGRIAATGVGIVLVEQQVAMALSIADRVVVLDKGTVAMACAASDERAQALITEVYLANSEAGNA